MCIKYEDILIYELFLLLPRMCEKHNVSQSKDLFTNLFSLLKLRFREASSALITYNFK